MKEMSTRDEFFVTFLLIEKACLKFLFVRMTYRIVLFGIAFSFIVFLSGCSTNIMPLGDSITHGYNGEDRWHLIMQEESFENIKYLPYDGYRIHLYNDLVDNSYNVDFVGSLNSCLLCGEYDHDHDGHGGWRADQILNNPGDNITNWLSDNPADAVLLQIGTNDILQDNTVESTVDEIMEIMDRVHQIRGNSVTIVLALITPMLDHWQEVREFNTLLKERAQDRVKNGDRIVIVDMENDSGLNAYFGMAEDRFHPNDIGYARIADVWNDGLTNTAYTWTKKADATYYIEGIAYGGGKYVAVGNYNEILTSSDGNSWSLSWAPGSILHLNDVIYGRGKFVAVGSGGTIVTSTDGNTWSRVNSRTSKTLWGVMYCDCDFIAGGTNYGVGKFVAVGSGGTIVISMDGTKWFNIPGYSGTDQTLSGVAYDEKNGGFIAVGSTSTVLYSDDGIYWSADAINYHEDVNFRSIACKPDRCAAVGESGKIVTFFCEFCDENANYYLASTAYSEITEGLLDITYANGLFVAVGYEGTILTSKDGHYYWTLRPSQYNRQLTGVAYGNNGFVATGFSLLKSSSVLP